MYPQRRTLSASIPWFVKTLVRQLPGLPDLFRRPCYAVVNADISAKSLITTASNWQIVDTYFLCPICSGNFTRISDFVCQGTCDESAKCLSYLPQILPCIANHCLKKCSPKPAASLPLVYSVYYINNGFKVFGNGNEEDDLHFFTVQDGNNESLFMCLTSECVADF